MTTRAHGIDISKYDQFFNPATATGQIDFVIQRASYRLTRDEAFTVLLPGVLTIPIRGAYHYLNSDTDWKAQADKFLSYTAGIDYHFYPCDFEGAFNVLSLDFAYKAWQFIQYIQDKTGKPAPLYTSLSLYNAYIQPSKARYNINWDTVPLWQAQWFNTPNPDGTPTNPTGRTGGWSVWQYTNKGKGSLYGCLERTEFDLDVYNGTPAQMRTWLNITTAPPPPAMNDVVTYPWDGCKKVTGTRRGWKFALYITDPAKNNYELVSTPALETVKSVAQRRGDKVAMNAGEWNDRYPELPTYLKPVDYTVSNGVVVMTRTVAAPPSFMVLNDNSIVLDHRTPANVRQAFSGLRYLISGGVISPLLNGTAATYTEGHTRKIDGKSINGHAMTMVSEGVYPNQGLLLKEAAQIFYEYGAVEAADFGGGGDVGGVEDGQDLIKPENIVNGVNVYRRLPMTFTINPRGVQPMPETFDYYEFTSIETDPAGFHAVRTGASVLFPYIAGSFSRWYNGKLAKGKATTLDSVTLTADVFNAQNVKCGMVGDVWRRIYWHDGHTVDGWVADIHMGKPTLNKKLVPTTPPVIGDPASIEMTLAAGSSVVIKDSNGVIVWQGTAK